MPQLFSRQLFERFRNQLIRPFCQDNICRSRARRQRRECSRWWKRARALHLPSSLNSTRAGPAEVAEERQSGSDVPAWRYSDLECARIVFSLSLLIRPKCIGFHVITRDRACIDETHPTFVLFRSETARS